MNARTALALLVLSACSGSPTTDTTADSDTQVAADTEVTQETGLSPSETAQGKTLYQDNCLVCHAAGGTGGAGPRLKGRAIPKALVIGVIKQGDGSMPSFRGTLTNAEIQLLASWLEQNILSH